MLSAKHFDMDGVLFDTEPYHVEAEITTCHDYDIAIDPNDWSGFKGRTAIDIFTHIVNTYDNPHGLNPEELVALKTECFLGIVARQGAAPINGALEYLEWCRSNFETVCLVTSSNLPTQQHLCDIAGITEYFDFITTGSEVENGKPHPDPYLISCDKSGTSPSEAVVTEDSQSGIQSAIAAGCLTLAIATSHSVESIGKFTPQPTFVAADYEIAQNTLHNLLRSV